MGVILEHSKKRTNPVIELYDIEQFLKYAKDASLVVYNTQLFSSPFLDENKIRQVNCYAIGVIFNGLRAILKHQKTWQNSKIPRNTQKRNPKDVIDTLMRKFVNQIKTELNGIEGNLLEGDSQPIWSGLF